MGLRLTCLRSVPPNASFYVDDLEDEWTFSAKFDFIFSRFMTGSIRDWKKYIGQCYEYVCALSFHSLMSTSSYG